MSKLLSLFPKGASIVSFIHLNNRLIFQTQNHRKTILFSILFLLPSLFINSLHAQCSGPTSLGGQVFADLDSDGTKDAVESGINNFPVEVYDVSGTRVCNTTTNVTGNWVCTGLIAGAKYRVEFVTGVLPFTAGYTGSSSNGNVTNVTAGNCGVHYAAFDPAFLCQSNPDMATTCFVGGTPTGTVGNGTAVVGFKYDGSGSPGKLAEYDQVGSTWGLAYRRQTKDLYTAAILKRHSALGPLGLGGIYRILNGVPTNWLDVTTLGVNVGTNPRVTPVNYLLDAGVFPLVGKIGLGDLDISDDGKTLYV
jgi:SdrD B-like domain